MTPTPTPAVPTPHRERGQGPETARLRAACLALPRVSEKVSHGEPTWFVGGRTFVMLADHHHDDRLALWCAAADGEQAALVASDPDRFFVPPYVGTRGWVGVRLDGSGADAEGLDWDVVEDLVERAYRVIAPPRAVAELDATAAAPTAGATS